VFFLPQYAVPLSNVTILGGAVANNAFNLFKRHPNPRVDRPMIDYDLVLLMEPTTIAGAVIGSVLNKILPEAVIASLLVLVLGATTWKTWTTGDRLALKEEEAGTGGTMTEEERANQSWYDCLANLVVITDDSSNSPAPEEEEQSKPLVSNEAKEIEFGTAGDHSQEEDRVAALSEGTEKATAEAALRRAKEEDLATESWSHTKQAIADTAKGAAAKGAVWAGISADLRASAEEHVREEAESFPLWKIGAITMCFFFVILCGVVKAEATQCGTPGYWLLLLAPVVATVSMMCIVRSYLLDKATVKKAARVEIEGDIHWDEKNTISYPAVCTLAGVFAGMFGIGGGIVKGPLMVEMGILPEVSSATAAFMILYTASSATVTYMAFDQIAYQFAPWFFLVGVVFTAIGQKAVTDHINRTGKKSLIVHLIAAIVGVSTLLMGYQSVRSAMESNKGFSGICDKIS